MMGLHKAFRITTQWFIRMTSEHDRQALTSQNSQILGLAEYFFSGKPELTLMIKSRVLVDFWCHMGLV